ncbi:MAG: polysaccharide lyase 8 family protein [Bacteroidetes bacterium]|nr:polysaccharide lyase 8 family protein [Bacteroidota bacterium]
MNYKTIYLIIVILVTFSCSIQEPKIYEQTQIYPEELQQLHRNVVTKLLEVEIDKEEVKQLLDGLKDDRTWPGIDYPSKTRGYWSPRFHLSNLLILATAYQSPGNEFYQKKDVSKKIHATLNYWLNNDFRSPNWWHPVIGTPMLLNPILILMEPTLSTEQLEKAMPILNRCEIGRTGQNKVWQSGNVLFTSLLVRDIEMVKKASASIQEELVVSTGEGVQPDWSYHQHGPQLQFGNYGLSYVGDMIKWISILRKTPFKFDESKVSILRNYLLEGQQWVSWKNEMDISACGRQIGPDRPATKAKSLADNFVKMQRLDPEYAGDYKKANDYKNLKGNKHFWRSDIQIQRNPEYYFSVKMSSNRVIGAESCNAENLQGYYLGDGASYLYQTGQEYKNIFPFWDWKKVPGTTTLQDEEPLPVLTASGYRIPSDFVGGVSDGENGIAVLDYNRLGLQAKKSWFMFDDKIVCMGAGINSETGLPVTTSVNQSYLNGEVEFKFGKEIIDDLPDEMGGYKWILHDNIGYFFPEPSTMNLKTDKVEGKWTDVTKLLSDETISADIFKLYFDHGKNPKNESYIYILIPNALKTDLEEMETELPFEIINSKSTQEVVNLDKSLAGIVFYEAGKSDIFGGVEVDKSCLLMLKKRNDGLQVSIADPTQKLSEINMILNGEFSGELATSENGKTKLKVILPQQGEAGKTVSLELNEIRH